MGTGEECLFSRVLENFPPRLNVVSQGVVDIELWPAWLKPSRFKAKLFAREFLNRI